MTYLSYLEDTYKFAEPARLLDTGQDDHGYFILLDRTLFHPQGGGQPSDQGFLSLGNRDVPVRMAKKVGSEVRHYTDQDYAAYKGQEGVCRIEEERRLANARLHSSGHLLNNIVTQLYPKWVAIKGHHFPREAYVEFAATHHPAPSVESEAVEVAMREAIKENMPLTLSLIPSSDLAIECPNLPYKLAVNDSTLRILRVGHFPAVPCGGTHVKSSRELDGFHITKCKIKGNALKIGYDLKSTFQHDSHL